MCPLVMSPNTIPEELHTTTDWSRLSVAILYEAVERLLKA